MNAKKTVSWSKLFIGGKIRTVKVIQSDSKTFIVDFSKNMRAESDSAFKVLGSFGDIGRALAFMDEQIEIIRNETICSGK